MTAIPMIIASSSSSPTMMMHRDEQQIRAHFLQSLGIVRTSAAPVVAAATTAVVIQIRDEKASEDVEQSSTTTKAALKGMPLTNDDDIVMTTTITKHVSFDETVTIHEIPSHRDYCPSTKKDLWNSVQAVAEIVHRCSLEFSFEGKDWRLVLEEDAFVRLPSGELMHPATYQRREQIKEQQRRLRKLQKKKQQANYGYKSISACLNFGAAPPTATAIKAKSSRRHKSSRRQLVVASSKPSQ